MALCCDMFRVFEVGPGIFVYVLLLSENICVCIRFIYVSFVFSFSEQRIATLIDIYVSLLDWIWKWNLMNIIMKYYK